MELRLLEGCPQLGKILGMLDDVGGWRRSPKGLQKAMNFECLNMFESLSHLWLFFFVTFMGVEEAVNIFSVLLDFSCRFVFSFP